tara:strand:+ start:945 stop:1364 length:420 start_codon:yes stop_codon:yes gene_type:complete
MKSNDEERRSSIDDATPGEWDEAAKRSRERNKPMGVPKDMQNEVDELSQKMKTIREDFIRKSDNRTPAQHSLTDKVQEEVGSDMDALLETFGFEMARDYAVQQAFLNLRDIGNVQFADVNIESAALLLRFATGADPEEE